MNPTLRKSLNWAGSCIAVIGIVFVVIRLRHYIDLIDLERFDATTWAVIASFSVLYGAANIFLTLAWRRILIWLDSSISYRRAIYIYGVSQVGKYVPGNIFHLAGRQALGMAAGVPGWVLAKSSFLELAFLIASALTFGSLIAPTWFHALPQYANVFIFAGLFVLLAISLRKFVSRETTAIYCYYLLFLCISGGLFAAVLLLISPSSSISAHQTLVVVGAFIIAWLIGLITPGAPAGVGVRELVLLFFLTNLVSESDLILAVVIGRGITVIGDFLYFIATLGLKKQISNN